MSFEVHLKNDIGNEIDMGVKVFEVATINIANGLLKKGSYYVPIDHILFIKEV